MTLPELLNLDRTGSLAIQRGGNAMRSLQEEMNRLFNDYFGDFNFPRLRHNAESAFMLSPAVDIAESEKGFRVTVEVPGMDEKDIQIKASEGYLTISGEKKSEKREEKEGWFRQERSYGEFQRVISLPEAAQIEKAEASLKNGLLTIAMPRKAGSKGQQHRIAIKKAA